MTGYHSHYIITTHRCEFYWSCLRAWLQTQLIFYLHLLTTLNNRPTIQEWKSSFTIIFNNKFYFILKMLVIHFKQFIVEIRCKTTFPIIVNKKWNFWYEPINLEFRSVQPRITIRRKKQEANDVIFHEGHAHWQS